MYFRPTVCSSQMHATALAFTVSLALVVDVVHAGTTNSRPITVSDTSLQNELDAMTVSGPGIDVATDQSAQAVFTNSSSGGGVSTFMFEVTDLADSNVIGIYDARDPSNKVPIFTGAAVTANQVGVGFLASGGIEISSVAVATFSMPLRIGFYLDVFGDDGNTASLDYTLYSEDSLNAGGSAQAVIFQGDGVTVIQIPLRVKGIFAVGEWIIAFEDRQVASGASDEDYSDTVVVFEGLRSVDSSCGDGTVDSPSETCDPPGQPGGANDNICRADCTVCGDGFRDSGEECDDGDSNDDDTCRNDCTRPICGDGIVDAGEQCDDGNNVGGDGCDPDCNFEIECTLEVDKTCCIPPPPADNFCKDVVKPLQTLTLTWNGPSPVNIETEAGQIINGIHNGDVVVLDVTDQGNDVDVDINGAVNGYSRFHVSCSDPDMNGPEDCGKAAGNSKDNKADRINLWVFEGFAGNEVLDCSADSVPQTETNCTGAGPFDCQGAKPITSLTMIWDGPNGVNIVGEGGQVVTGINNGDLVLIEAAGLGNDVELTISGAISGKSRFHVSCSDKEMNGPEDCGKPQGDGKDNKSDRINLWLFAGLEGDLILDCTPVDPDDLLQDSCEVTEGGAVEYQYTITNTSSVAVDVTAVLDNKLGELLAPDVIMLGAGESVTLFETAKLGSTTTNVVTVDAEAADGSVCSATDEVIVDVASPPFDCKAAKPIETLTLIWDGPDGVNISGEGGQIITGIKNGDEVVIEALGLGNDVELIISGAVRGKSKFHVSCSDEDMNGPEDCGKLQGDGKAGKKGPKPGMVNLWIFEGMSGSRSLDCTP